MSTRHSPLEPVAPYSGTLRYPAAALLDLARSITRDLERHHRALLDAASEADNDDDYAEEVDNVVDLDGVMFTFDLLRYKARMETDNPNCKWEERHIQDFNDPNIGERGLITMGKAAKVEWVMGRAIARRKEVRGPPPASDPSWKNEDALLDFLEFLSRANHVGLFYPVIQSNA
ncbi:hypothetical protein BD410DRAFT_748639 [Rickenella mellea]|uniref:Uncharacterized protein n=1 Tax=Rickenella mellea TaxID=50990 RepID=A0A4Y7Q6E0_9AGAM|nr:hypothetical protein BD410DRAFT_748639 [Rickenella mellea]